MISIEDEEVLYLDDEAVQRTGLEQGLMQYGIKVSSMKSIEKFINSSKDGIYNIYISDYKLDQIDENINGVDVLLRIRDFNKDALLILLTAFSSDINLKVRNLLELKDILILDKDEYENVVINLEQFYNDHIQRRQALKHGSSDELAIPELERAICINYLKGLSNQNVMVPIPGNGSIKAEELILDIQSNGNVGELFLVSFLKTIKELEIKRKM